MKDDIKRIIAGYDPIYPIFDWLPIWAPLIACLCLIPIVWWLVGRASEPVRRSTVLYTLILVLGCQWGLHAWLAPKTVGQIIDSHFANSFYTVPQQYSLSRYLGDFLAIRPNLPLHATSNMPGKSMLFYALSFIRNDPSTQGFVVMLLIELGGLFAFAIAAELFASQLAGFYAAILYWVYPGKAWFSPLLNALTPTFLLGSLWLLIRCVKSPTWARIAACGLAIYAMYLFEPLPMGTFLLFAVILFYSWRTRVLSPAKVAKICVGVAVTFLTAHGALYAVSGFDSIGVLFELMRTNASYYETYVAPIWPLRDLADLGVSLGYGTSLAVLYFGIKNIRGPMTSGRLYGIAMAATLAIYLALGVTRAEVPRLWIFLGSAIIPLAAGLIWKYAGVRSMQLVVTANLIQLIFGLYYIGFVWWPN